MLHAPPRLRRAAALLVAIASLAALPTRAFGQGLPGDPGCEQGPNVLPPTNPLCFYFTERNAGPTFITPIGIIRIINVQHGPFFIVSRDTSGGDEIETFRSTINATLQVEGQADRDITLTDVAVQTRVFGRALNPFGTYETEMLDLRASFEGIQLRESPTLRSSGRTTVTERPGGVGIESFFDIFTELSLNGQPFIPAAGGPNNPERVTLRITPEPSTVVLAAGGLLALAAAGRLRRRTTTL